MSESLSMEEPQCHPVLQTSSIQHKSSLVDCQRRHTYLTEKCFNEDGPTPMKAMDDQSVENFDFSYDQHHLQEEIKAEIDLGRLAVSQNRDDLHQSHREDLEEGHFQANDDLRPAPSGMRSSSDSSGHRGQKVFQQVEQLQIAKKKQIVLWIKVYFTLKTVAAIQSISLLAQWTEEARIVVGLLFVSYACSCVAVFIIFYLKREHYIFYELIFSCTSGFLTTIFFELGPEKMAKEGTRAREVSLMVKEMKITIWLVILQIITIATNYIEREKQRKQFFGFLCGCFIVSYILPFRRYILAVKSGEQEFMIPNVGFYVMMQVLTLFFSFILFKTVNISQLLFLVEKDQTNRYRYMFNSIKDFILVLHQDEVVFKNRNAARVLRQIKGENEEDHQGLSQPWLYVYQDFKDSSSQGSGEPADRGTCNSIQDLLKMEFAEVSSLIFTTEKQIAESQSLDKFQNIIDKLGKQDDSSQIPLFVQVKLFRVQKEVIEDLWEEGDEIMVQIQDVSHRILGQNLKIERQYLTIMNSTVSHEMRNPLNALLSSVEVQSKKVDELSNFLAQHSLRVPSSEMIASFKKSLGVSRSSCKLLRFNVEDILALPQIQQGKFTKNISQVDLGSAVDEVLKIMEFQASEKEIGVSVSFEGFPEEDGAKQLRLAMDEQRFQQVLLNYFSNAIKFTKKKGRIQITLTFVGKGSRARSFPKLQEPLIRSREPSVLLRDQSYSSSSSRSANSEHHHHHTELESQEPTEAIFRADKADLIVLTIIDSGIGIKLRDQQKLFKLFGCLKATKKINTKGVGLGLAISKMITEEFGGQVAVRSRVNQGSAFYASFSVNEAEMVLPSKLGPDQDALAHRLQAIKLEQLRKAKQTLETLSLTGKELAEGKRVLVIDDEAYNLEVLAVILEVVGLPRSRFDLCMSGEEALQKVKEYSSPAGSDYAVVLTDLSMPFIDGFQFTRRMRRLLEKEYQLPRASQPLVAAVTGHTENEFFQHAFESKIDQVYSKPLTSEAVQLILTEAGFQIKLKPTLEHQILHSEIV